MKKLRGQVVVTEGAGFIGSHLCRRFLEAGKSVNDVEFTMFELAGKIISVSGSSSKIVLKPLPEDDPMQRRPDLTKARKTLE